MKISQLKTIVKEAVKEAIQEEIKDILLEAVKSPKQVVSEYKPSEVSVGQPSPTNPVSTKSRADGTMKATTSNIPLQVNGTMDTTSPNGALPQGNVSMDQIMGLMNKK